MTYGEDYLNQLLDRVIDYAGDWNEMLEMVAEGEQDGPLFLDYLEQLVPRIKQMQRRFNWVDYKDHSYRIHNYTYKMYKWFKRQNFDQGIITPCMLVVHESCLAPKQRKQFQEMLVS